jgi:hypothetical protein
MDPKEDEYISKIKTLNETLWERKVSRHQVEGWLANFEALAPDYGERRLHALHLASHFMYFGDRQIRELTRVIFRDLYKYPIVEQIRKVNGDTTDAAFIGSEFAKVLNRTRFLALGNASESGGLLLYFFRQENVLPKTRFAENSQVIRRDHSGQESLRYPTVERYVFIDDFCGSGSQAIGYGRDSLSRIKSLAPSVHASYFSLFATTDGLDEVRTNTNFDAVECVYELDSSFRCFGDDSRYFLSAEASIIKAKCEQMCLDYGRRLLPSDPLGFGDCQLLIGFHHNTPDNTLPVIWYDEEAGPAWFPLFRRYTKVYS